MTPLGKMLRQERKERGMTLAEMADGLGMSSPYLSQMETGKRDVQDHFVEKVIRLLDLNATDAARLRRAAAASLVQSTGTVTISLQPDTPMRDRELATNFALSFAKLKPETKKIIRELLKDNKHG